jgi:hypothetical protein
VSINDQPLGAHSKGSTRLVGIIVADIRFIDWASFPKNGSARRLSDGCPIRISRSEWDDNPKAGWVREVGIALTGYHVRCAVRRVSTVSTNPRACKGFRDDIIAALRL